jgi:hypothetical protein
VLKLFDEKVRPNPDQQIVLEWIDASAMLWRLKLEGVDTGDRFAKLAACWERAGEDAFYAFNDLHAIMAFLGAGRMADADRTLKAMRQAAADGGDNGYMTRKIGLPLAEAFVAFEAGRYGECVEKIASVRGIAQRFGGSHAQRDVIAWTLTEAALRGGHGSFARALAQERLALKPHSPVNRGLLARAGAMPSLRRAA